MANSLLSGTFAKASFQILDVSSFTIVQTNLKVVKVSVKWASTVMRHMREDGVSTVDSRVLRPAIVMVQVICPDANALDAANALLASRSTVFRVITKGIVIPNLMVDEEQLQQMPDQLSSTPMTIRFKQIQIQGIAPIIFKHPTDASIINRGLTLLGDAEQKVSDLYGKVTSSIDSISSRIGGLF
jgi:hypothetical protein